MKKQLFQIFIFSITLIVIGWSTTSCHQDRGQFIASKRKLIDTLYKEKIKLVKIELDSICDKEFDANVNHAVDSILAIRLKDIEELINRQIKANEFE